MYRYLLILLLSAISPFLSSQTKLSLDEAIRASIRHKPSLEILRLQEKQENLSLQEIKARWWPEISLSYNYRYNPVVATSILPIGQFDINNPTNEVRGIKMGTKWQQNGGLSISQPLIDFSIIRAVRQSKNLCKLAITNQKIGRDELIYETARCYLTICQKEKILENSIQDTLRTFTTLRLQEALFRHERLLVSDLNRARINHNESVNLLENTRTDLLTEKIFLSFLTGFTPDSLILFTRFDYDPAISL
ncbi:MAG: TolC family protein, partial [Bacteroidales bacterium]